MRALVALAILAVPSGTMGQSWNEIPDGFDPQVWNYMTRDQKIDVIAKIQTSPEPLAKDSESAAKDAIKADLKDPDSAEFKGVRRLGAFQYCGFVNAKNALGGYVGYALFFANAKWTVLLDPSASDPKFCV